MIFRSNLQASFAAILIVLGIVVFAMSGCATDCSYKSDMYCVHVEP